jgi:hypothetical protein
MNRILDLQKLDSSMDDSLEAAAASTSSALFCNCSTFSNSGCTPPKDIISI